MGNAWKIGRKGVGDGVLLVVAKDDRKVRIEVAKTLEGAIPDLAAKQIIDEAITPNFRKGDFAAGLQAAADQLIARINGEALPEPPSSRTSARRGGGSGFDWMDLAIFLFFAVPIVGGVLRRMLGASSGSLALGGCTGAVAMVLDVEHRRSPAIAGVVALLFSLLSRRGCRAWRRPRAAAGAAAALWMRRLGGWSGGGGGGGGGGGWGSARAAVAISAAAAPRGTGDGTSTIRSRLAPHAAASLAGRSRHAQGASRPTCSQRLAQPRRRQRDSATAARSASTSRPACR